MKLFPSTVKDVPAIMKIVGDAQHYLASLGIDQWQDGYPTVEQIKTDIENQDSYVIYNSDEQIIGTTVFTFKEEKTYRKISNCF